MAANDELAATPRRRTYDDHLRGYETFDYIERQVRFADRALLVNGAPLRAGRIFAAAGAAPALADIPGVADVPVLTRTIAFELPE